jgi:Radical SAM superfamily
MLKPTWSDLIAAHPRGLRRDLIKCGICSADSRASGKNELRLAEYRARDFLPPNLYVQISNHCNLRCAMCGHKNAIKDDAYMDAAVFRRVLDEARASKIENLVFAAAFGETLLHPQAIHFLREAKERGFKITVATNGNFLDAVQIARLAALNLYCIQYSFFGYDKPTYEKTYIGGVSKFAFAEGGHPATSHMCSHCKRPLASRRVFRDILAARRAAITTGHRANGAGCQVFAQYPLGSSLLACLMGQPAIIGSRANSSLTLRPSARGCVNPR